MHPNPIFHQGSAAANIAFARDRGFGMLAVADQGAPILAHIPFLLAEDGGIAELHLVRSNPIARVCTAALPARIAVSGPDAYVSPDWYAEEDQVPTWNYIAVHLEGRLEPLPQGALRDLLDRQSAFFEGKLRPKPPWSTSKMSEDVLRRMMRAIAPFRFLIDTIDGTWKLNQNKPDASRLRAADQVELSGLGQETAALAGLMRSVDSN